MGILSQLLRKEPCTMSDHIITTKKAALRTRDRLDEIAARYNPHTGHCCPSCASAEYRELCDKQERRLHWLAVMLRRRNHDGDATLAAKIDQGVWPP